MTTNEAISYLEDEVNTLEEIESCFASVDFADCPENEECLRKTVCELEVRRMSINALCREESNLTRNVAEGLPYDAFVCSNCDIRLKGWYRELGMVAKNQYGVTDFDFRYCPNCGRKLQPTRYHRSDSVL